MPCHAQNGAGGAAGTRRLKAALHGSCKCKRTPNRLCSSAVRDTQELNGVVVALRDPLPHPQGEDEEHAAGGRGPVGRREMGGDAERHPGKKAPLQSVQRVTIGTTRRDAQKALVMHWQGRWTGP